MSLDQRLAEVVSALEAVDVQCLVMGGHAARYYGLDRMTDDFDLQLAPSCFDDLADRLARSDFFRKRKVVEVPSWRLGAFRRFEIGTLPSGREEWLEFWKENHLLPDFDDAYARRESGEYGGRVCDFLSLGDLIRAKETEWEKDWVDIQYLEEVQDARLAASARDGFLPLTAALSRLRTRRGLELHLRDANLSDSGMVADAIAQASTPITVALLLPSAPQAVLAETVIEAAIENRLRALAAGSPLHLTLVEAVRRRYKQDAMLVDKADKEAFRQRVNHEG